MGGMKWPFEGKEYASLVPLSVSLISSEPDSSHDEHNPRTGVTCTPSHPSQSSSQPIWSLCVCLAAGP